MAHIVGTASDDTGVTALVGTNDADQIDGLAGNDTLYGEGGNDTLDGGAGVDRMYGGAGDDSYVVDNTGDVASEQTVAGIDDGGQDTVLASVSYHLGNGIEKLVLTGFAGINATGNASDNTLIGNTGNNVLNGGVGGDFMYGLAGDDAYFVDSAADLVFENAGEGTDKVISSVDYTLTANVENLTLTGSAIYGIGNSLSNTIVGTAGANILQGADGDDTLNGGSGADTMTGGIGNDRYYVNDSHDLVIENAGEGSDTVVSSLLRTTLAANVETLTLVTTGIYGTGNELNNALNGDASDNVLDGMGGSDRLDGGAGADRMLGGAGDDTYFIDNVGDRAVETHDGVHDDGGRDVVRSTISFQLGAFLEDLTLLGTDDTKAFGNDLNNVLTGNAGDNVLSGGAGADRMVGGLGDDTYIIDSAGDKVVENTGEGSDTVISTVTYTLAANVETLRLYGTDNISGAGNALDNSLFGNAGDNTLNGLDGTDHMFGGAGNDTYLVDNAGDVASEQTIAGVDDGGIDLVLASASYTLGDFFENLSLLGNADISGTGNGLDNVISGNSGNNLIDGGVGEDILSGGGGNDTYIVDNAGDTVVESSFTGSGTDLVMASVSYALSINVENLTLTGTNNLDGAGNASNNIIQGNAGDNHIDGGDGDDTLTGGAGIDTLSGGAGADMLHGDGMDTLIGGAGNDTYVLQTTGDVIVETSNPDDGMDTIQAGFSYTLGDNLENLTLTGTGDFTATGNGGDNVLIGNAGSNVLDGGGGLDTMKGGNGDDTYIIAARGDVIVETFSGGTDTIWASVSYQLPAHVEKLVLTGDADIDAGGDMGNDILIGNSGDNQIFGALGDDQLWGGAGADTFYYEADSGHDTIEDFSSAEGDRIELVFTGNTATTFSQVGNDTLVRFTNGSTILVLNAAADDVSAHTFEPTG